MILSFFVVQVPIIHKKQQQKDINSELKIILRDKLFRLTKGDDIFINLCEGI